MKGPMVKKDYIMEPYILESEEASIVFVGSFNPAIFHPEWLLRCELIPEDDLKGANVEIIHNDLSKFALEWLGIDVLRSKFIARTNDPSKFSPLKDLMISAFKILEHTPINQLGMNVIRNYIIENEEYWHKIGDTLAPKNVWELSLPKRVGLKKINIVSGRNDDLIGEINVSLEPFVTKEISFGVRFNINNHVELKDEKGNQIYDVTDILFNNWDSTLHTAHMICSNTLLGIIEK